MARKALKTGHLEDLKVRTARYENFLDDKFESSKLEIDLARRECLDRTTRAKLNGAFCSGRFKKVMACRYTRG